MKKIALNGKYGEGKFTLVDDEDYEWLNQFKWYVCRGYVFGTIAKDTKAYMHVLILKPPPDMETDHENLNKLNNQRYNLRVCTRTQNIVNRKKRKDSTHEYKGTYFDGRRNKWGGRITVNKKRIFLGHFKTECEAAKAYNKRALEAFGRFALLNNI